VADLAQAHVAAFNKMKDIKGFNTYNIGTGHGYTVLETLKTYSKVIGKEIPHKFIERRPGDIDRLEANVEKASRELHWKAKYNLEDMCRDSYNFVLKNPNGIN